ncbi:pullulanase [Streptococcus suis]|nr:pullulanase [Streptococcus suis]
MNHLTNRKRSIFSDRRQFFGIRKLKVGVASVLLASALMLGGASVEQVLAQEATSEAAEVLVTEQPAGEEQAVEEAPLVSEGRKGSASDAVARPVVIDDTSSSTESVDAAETPSIVEAAASVDQVPDEKAPIAEQTIRVHFEEVTEDAEQYGLWTWGAVENPSDGSKWPSDAQPFSNNQKDEFGHYIDVKQAESKGDIGYLLLKNGEKVAEGDQKIQPISPEVNEVWVRKDFTTYTYQPLSEDHLVRINYRREDNNYDGWGVWLWGDVEKASGKWPTDALEFTEVGPYGAYVDVPLSRALDSNVGFLILNKKYPEGAGNKSVDFKFSDRKEHSQIFLRQGDDTVYTNPYYVATVTGQDFAKAVPGNKAVQVTATSLRAFNSNETGIIDVQLDNPNQAVITRMTVDTRAIGGGEITISPELNRVTITASSTTQAGSYDLPVRVYDADNGYYDGRVTVTISPRERTATKRDWDEQVIYFMLTDRFYNGNPANDNPYNQPYASAKNMAGTYKGGDFKGVTEKLDYLKELGVTSIWVTPIVENVPQNVSTDEGGEYYAYHGYWAKNFEALNPHLGTLAEFHELIDQAAARGITIIVDVVLNHAGYGAEETFKGMVRTKEEDKQGDDEKGSLSNLPDFKTEEKAVRDQLVAWQTEWLKKATTAKGNSIYGFRVDTVKHVDDVTWQHFKNELALKDKDFHLLGESWGANYKDTKGDLGTGTMDSLLDFGFKDIAKLAVNGRLKQAEEELVARNKALSSNYTLAQFLGSHDEDGFLYSIENDIGKFKLAASLLVTAKGQPVIYYGEELGQSGANNWPVYDNRYDFDWASTQSNSILEHYRKVLAFRNAHSTLLSRGERSTVAVNDSQQWLLSKRSTDNDAAYLLFNAKTKAQTIRVVVSDAATQVQDAYSGKIYTAVEGEDGKWYVDLEAPSLADGGTMLLTATSGDLLSATVPEASDEAIQENHLRIHFKQLPSDNLDSLGLWIWEDVAEPSNGWPNGALSLSQVKQDSYGYYLDVKLIEGERDKIGLLINNTAGTNLTGDKVIDLISPDMNEVWLDETFKAHYYQPQAEKTIRINYLRTDGHYANKSIWFWGDVDKTVSDRLGDWPNGIDFEHLGKYGAYLDVKLSDVNSLGFLLLDESKTGDDVKIQPTDYIFKDLKNHTQLFVRDDDPTIYTNPYFVNTVRMTGAQQISPTQIQASLTSLEGVDKEHLLKNLALVDHKQQPVTIIDLTLDTATNRITLKGEFTAQQSPYQLTYLSDRFDVRQNWQYKDALYAYDGELGARVSDEGATVALTVWSPSADQVSVILYDKQDPDKVVGKVAMTKGEKGEWSATLNHAAIPGVSDFRGYYYHYAIQRGGKTALALDPYAKSLAAWNSDLADKGDAYKVAKAAIVDVAAIGQKDKGFATIQGFTSREDAIIYEAHVRDFTSDPAISGELSQQFGTFAAFIDKLDYLKSLGVTHVQLLPVMSYYFANEGKASERMLDYRSSDTNYNWGYDPQSYFALTGMYSTDPTNPAKRIAEFKQLVSEIHKRGMGVILDVVYNHTAKVDLFEDLEPNYYHFMDNQGTAKTSFGGGRLGTTHYMTRRVLVDSIRYLVDEFKVDGFRFDMMGDHDATAIEAAYNAAKALNPNIIMLGEGWITYAGDDNMPEQPADQTWMAKTDTVASFSDDIRNQLKSGYPNEGTPAFITGGAKSIETIFNNIKAQPSNFVADDPGDVIQYIAAHDNLTLFDIIAQSIKKDPSQADNLREIHKRLRLGNLLVLTSQGTPFIHSGQEYGRSKQFLAESHRQPVADDQVPNKAHLLTNADGSPFDYPYFIHDSYDSTDAINRFDWTKATDSKAYPEHVKSQAFTRGLIALRRSTDAFRLKTKEDVDQAVTLITQPNANGVTASDLIIAYQTVASNGEIYAVFVNADTKARDFVLTDAYQALRKAEVLVDGSKAGTVAITSPVGVVFTEHGLRLDPLTATVLRLAVAKEVHQPEQETVKGINGKDQVEKYNQTEQKLPVVTPKQETVVSSSQSSSQSVVEEQQAVRELPQTGESDDYTVLSVAGKEAHRPEQETVKGINGNDQVEKYNQTEQKLPVVTPKQETVVSSSQSSSQSVVEEQQTVRELPQTGESDDYTVLSVAGMVGLTALGLVESKRRPSSSTDND